MILRDSETPKTLTDEPNICLVCFRHQREHCSKLLPVTSRLVHTDTHLSMQDCALLTDCEAWLKMNESLAVVSAQREEESLLRKSEKCSLKPLHSFTRAALSAVLLCCLSQSASCEEGTCNNHAHTLM